MCDKYIQESRCRYVPQSRARLDLRTAIARNGRANGRGYGRCRGRLQVILCFEPADGSASDWQGDRSADEAPIKQTALQIRQAQALAETDAKLAKQLHTRLTKTRGETISKKDTEYLIRKLKAEKEPGERTAQLLFNLVRNATLEDPSQWAEIFSAVAKGATELRTILPPDKLAAALQGYASAVTRYGQIRDEDVLKLIALGSVHGIPGMVVRQSLESIRRLNPSTKQAAALFAKELNAIPLAPKKEWTIFVYMASANNLEGWAVGDLQAMEKEFGSIAKVANVVVLADGGAVQKEHEGTGPAPASNWVNRTRLLMIEEDPGPQVGAVVSHEIPVPPECDLGQLLTAGRGKANLGSGHTLKAAIDFVQEGVESDSFFMSTWSHGVAWKGVAEDEEDFLRPHEITPALSNTKRPIDVMGFDACLMANDAFGNLLSKLGVKYMVGSQELLDASGWGYDNVFKGLAATAANNDGKLSPEQLAHTIVDSASGTTISAIDLSMSETMWGQLEQLGATLLDAGGRENPDIRRIVKALPRYGSYGVDAPASQRAEGDEQLVDIVQFCEALIEKFNPESEIGKAALQLKQQVGEAAHFKNEASPSYPGIEDYSHGLTTYLPKTGEGFSMQYIGKGAIWKHAVPKWIEFLRQPKPLKKQPMKQAKKTPASVG